MGKTYATEGSGTPGTNKTMLTVIAAATVRPKVKYICIGAGGTPADQAGVFVARRITADGTGTSVTPTPLDPADVAALATSKENYSAEPTYASNAALLVVGMNQRNTFQWWAIDDEGALVVAATAGAGLGIKSESHTATPTTDVTMHWQE